MGGQKSDNLIHLVFRVDRRIDEIDSTKTCNITPLDLWLDFQNHQMSKTKTPNSRKQSQRL